VGIEALLEAGTTHVGDVSWSGESVEPLSRSGLKGIVWVELRGLTPRDGRRRLEWVRGEVDRLRSAAARSPMQIGAEVHSPYLVHPRLWDPMLRWIEDEKLPLCIHAAESPSEGELFLFGTGALVRTDAWMALSALPRWARGLAVRAAARLPPALRSRAFSALPRGGMTPIAFLEQVGVLRLNPLLVHMVQVTDGDIERVAKTNAVVVHCPRSNTRLQCGRMPIEKFVAAGIRVVLGTDSLASSPSLDVRDDLVAARELHGDRVDPVVLAAMLADASALGLP
jgi:cytosine/adenosine deaminase-related metal-dependent hydrolase